MYFEWWYSMDRRHRDIEIGEPDRNEPQWFENVKFLMETKSKLNL